jgi:hypothetical protein
VGKGGLYTLKMGMLTSSHALVFGSLKGSLIRLPPFQDGQLIGNADVVGIDDLYGTLESSSDDERHPGSTPLVVLGFFLLYGTSLCVSTSRTMSTTACQESRRR